MVRGGGLPGRRHFGAGGRGGLALPDLLPAHDNDRNHMARYHLDHGCTADDCPACSIKHDFDCTADFCGLDHVYVVGPDQLHLVIRRHINQLIDVIAAEHLDIKLDRDITINRVARTVEHICAELARPNDEHVVDDVSPDDEHRD